MKTKRLLAVFCTVMMLCVMLTGGESLALTQAEKSLYTRIDPTTGKTYDLKGKTVYLYDWWSTDWRSIIPVTDADEALYNYHDWIERTYNCKVVTTVRGDWGSIGNELADFVNRREKKLALFTLSTKDILGAVSGNYIADWKKSVSISLSDRKWNQSTIRMMTFADKVFGVSTGSSEPRQCLFFNKRVLGEAGIDWNRIYDLQNSGKWTWNELTKMLKDIHRGDVYGLTGNGDDWYRIAVFSNGGSFFDYDANGELVSTVSNPNSKEGLVWAKKTWAQYAARQPQGANWDWYQEFWKQGKVGFYIGQFYENQNMRDMADDWGFVAFPKGPKANNYVTIVSNNITVIPNIYTADEIAKITMIYDLWTCNPPDWDEEEAVPYLPTDDRAIYETYLMLSNSEHGVYDRSELLGEIGTILGANLLWHIRDTDIDELIESAQESWEAYLQAFKRITNRLQEEIGQTSATVKGLRYELDPDKLTAKVTGAEKKDITSVTVPDTIKIKKKTYKVITIGEKAFRDYKKLKTVMIGKNVKTAAKEAFKGCISLQKVSGAANLVVIGDGVFSGCSKLSSFTLNKKVASIGDDAFLQCRSLKSIAVKTKKLYADVVGKNAFKDIYKKATFKCPSKELANTYKGIFIKSGAPEDSKFTY